MTDHIDQLLHLIQQLRDRLHAAEAEPFVGFSQLVTQCEHLVQQRDELIYAIRAFVELNKGTHGRQWLKAMDEMCRLANVKP